MSVAAVCEAVEPNVFPATWNYQHRLTALMRKVGFIELNQYLKEKEVINRYKRNIPLGESFESAYSKVVSSMIRDLIIYVFSGVNIEAIDLEKMRGYPSYYFSMTMPRDNAAYRRILIALEDLRIHNFLSWSTWQMRAGERILFTLSFGGLAVTARSVGDQTDTLTEFIAKLTTLAGLLRECHPAPVQITIPAPAPEAIIPEVATELLQTAPAPVATVAPVPVNPMAVDLVVQETERRHPIILRRIN
jgi:hypothetical protein